MSISDLILAIFILAGAAIILWVLELNPYSKQIQVYTQTCDNMILDQSHCKGDWMDNPVKRYSINQGKNQIIAHSNSQSEPTIYEACQIQDSKNWSCSDKSAEQTVAAKNGVIVYAEKSDTRQISRLQWLQNKFLEWLE